MRNRRLKIYRGPGEGSTRTVDTFCEAGHRLGFSCRNIEGQLSSAIKGESLEDLVMAITRVGGMGSLDAADFLIIRHKDIGAAATAAQAIQDADYDEFPREPLPVINAGDGAGQHPTQALVDLFTIFRERNCDGHALDDFTIVMAGDTRYSRTVNSLCHILGRFGQYHQIRIIFSSHEEVGPKEGLTDYLEKHSIEVSIEPNLKDVLPEADACYMTRIQKERLPSPDVYNIVKGIYVLTEDDLGLLKEGAFIMHPLPIKTDDPGAPPEIDADLCRLARRGHPQCAWGRQSMRGIPVRYGLLDIIEAGIQQQS